MNLFQKISFAALATVLALTLGACGNNGAEDQSLAESTSKTANSAGSTVSGKQIDSSINQSEMLQILGGFFHQKVLSEEDKQQAKEAALREGKNGGRLPSYITGETPTSPAVVASAQSAASAGATVSSQMAFLNSTPVYRFYNQNTGIHFYTASLTERNYIIATWSQFLVEGTGFFASSAQEPNTSPVYRFFNRGNGGHFYTINAAERDSVIANLSAYYDYEGVVWHANPNPAADLTPMYRFWNSRNGAHFYTVSSTERADVIAKYPFLIDEGIAYYVATSQTYTVGGTVSGLAASQAVTLTLNGTTDVTVSNNGSYVVPFALSSAQSYAVTVKTQPASQTCSVANGSGMVAAASVTNVAVTCSNVVVPVTIGGSVTGMGAGKSVVLSLNGGSDLSVSSNTSYTFAGTIFSGQSFAVTIKTQPIGQTCTVTNGSGTVPAANVINVGVNCLNNVTISGSASGLNSGKSVTLRLNGTENVTVSSNTGFGFSSILTSGQTYSVLIQTQPVGQICTIANGTGTATSSNVTNVTLSCVTQVQIGGTVSGLGAGKTVTLTLNGSNDLAVTNSSFQFPTILTTGQLYNVVIKTQPTGQTCTVANNSGSAAAANVTNVAVTCLNNVTIGGTLSGLNASIAVTITLNGGSDLTLSSNGSYTFATTVSDMQTFSVVVKTQPIGQTCSVANGNATAAGNMTNVAVICVNNSPSGLLISEVASCPSTICWFEVFNPTSSSVNLSAYNLRTLSSVNGLPYTFTLPNTVVAPNAYAVVMGNPSSNIKALNPQTALVVDGTTTPDWSGSGFVELISVGTGNTVDFVKFGSSTQVPTTSTHWVGAQATALNGSSYGYSIVRTVGSINLQDSNSATDWTSVSFTTPGGQNDIPANAVDNDADGIPDSAELAGSTYAGMDLYSMGARQSVRDIFVEVDHMDSTDPGIIPRAEALQKVVDAFAAKGIAMHFDTGTQFSASFNASSFNLGQGNSTVPYEKCVTFNDTTCSGNTSQLRSAYDWKLAHFDLRRKNIFHYMLFGNSQLNSGLMGSSGLAEISGNDSMVTLGGWGLTTSPDANRLINYQAGTIMHEFGHNLSLRHGGNEDVNYKPNYYSVMNYLYQLNGLALSPSSIGPFQRWTRSVLGVSGTLCSMLNSACGSPSQFIIDYSNGTSASLNENALSESANIGRGADFSVYADWDSSGASNASTYAKDINLTSTNSVLTDHNDWANLYLAFHRGATAQSGISPSATSNRLSVDLDPMSNDQQPLSDCTPNALWLRLAMQSR